MALQFTTLEAIAQRMQGRWQVGVGLGFGTTLVPESLIIQLAQQSESKLLSVLGAIYRLPLVGSHPFLAQYVELDVICNMSPLYVNQNEKTNDSNLVPHACQLATSLLKQITSGVVVLPGESFVAPPVIGEVYPTNAFATYQPPEINWSNSV